MGTERKQDISSRKGPGRKFTPPWAALQQRSGALMPPLSRFWLAWSIPQPCPAAGLGVLHSRSCGRPLRPLANPSPRTCAPRKCGGGPDEELVHTLGGLWQILCQRPQLLLGRKGGNTINPAQAPRALFLPDTALTVQRGISH